MSYMDNLVSWWNMSNTNPLDIGWKGNNNTGFSTGLVASTDIVDGLAGGKALQFNGADEFIECGNDVSLQITGSITISIWFRKTTPSFGNLAGLLSKGGFGEMASYQLTHNNDRGIYFLCSQDGGAWNTLILSTTKINDGLWHHAVGTSDGVNAYLYIDGEFEGIDTGPAITLWNSNAEVTLGCESKPSDNSVGRFWLGDLDHGMIFNEFMTQSQVKDLYNRIRKGTIR